MNAMSRDIQFVLHQHRKSPQLLGLGPTQRFKRSLKLLCYLSWIRTLDPDLLEADDLFHCIEMYNQIYISTICL